MQWSLLNCYKLLAKMVIMHIHTINIFFLLKLPQLKLIRVAHTSNLKTVLVPCPELAVFSYTLNNLLFYSELDIQNCT